MFNQSSTAKRDGTSLVGWVRGVGPDLSNYVEVRFSGGRWERKIEGVWSVLAERDEIFEFWVA